MNAEYLLFNIVVISLSSIPLILKIVKPPKILPGLVAVLLVGSGFVVWDSVVTDLWWSFNERYIMGITIFNLPIEEILFFLVVPWSCLVIWESIRTKINGKVIWPVELILMLIFTGVSSWAIFNGWWYTAVVCLLSIIFVFQSWITKRWILQKNKLIFIVIVSALTLVFNYYLTARPVVIYNPLVKSNLNVTTVPIEDFVYGVLLTVGVVQVYERLKLKK